MKAPEPYLTERHWAVVKLVLLMVFFWGATHIGLAYQDELAAIVRAMSPAHSSLLTDPQEIYSLWAVLLGVHAAVGAVAPILGFTLLATTITSASRIAPSGAVIALEIGWTRYLQQSLALLAASAFALVSAPSALGLALACVATVYVVLKTLFIFKEGFTLAERPEQFDKGARRYLVNALSPGVAPRLSKGLQDELTHLNTSLTAASSVRAPRKHLPSVFLGDSRQITQLIRVDRNALKALESEARKLGLELYYHRSKCPPFLPRGEMRFFSVAAVSLNVEKGTAQAPQATGNDMVDQAHINRLQELARDLVVYGPGDWADDYMRAPMIMGRHIEAVIFEAIPGHRPHDLQYGLDVLGEIADELAKGKAEGQGVEYLLHSRWVISIPSLVLEQIENSSFGSREYTKALVSYIRERLWYWFKDPRLDQLSRTYLTLLMSIFRTLLRQGERAAEGIAAMIRTLAQLDVSNRREVVLLIEKELILLLVTSDDHVLSATQRLLVLKTIVEVIKFSRVERAGDVYYETCMSALALSLFRASSDEQFKPHVQDVIDVMLTGNRTEVGVPIQLRALARIDEIIEQWRWDWWEIEQKEGTGSYLVEIDGWLAKAGLVVLSARAWELRQTADEDLPAEYTIDRLMRLLDDAKFLELLPQDSSRSIPNLRTALEQLRARRAEIVSRQVTLAAIDVDKVKEFVDRELDSAATELASHNLWIQNACGFSASEDFNVDRQYGVSTLMPKQSFVADDVLDVPVQIGNSGLGQSVEDIEIRSVVGCMRDAGIEENIVETLEGGETWGHVRDLIVQRTSYIWIMGSGVSEYDVWDHLQMMREFASHSGVELRFDSIAADSPDARSIIVIANTRGIGFTRYVPQSGDEPIYERSLPPENGGIYSSISGIPDELQAAWIDAMADGQKSAAREIYAKSVLLRTLWSFEVTVEKLVAKEFRVG